jgi:hypothetical protein
VGRRIRRRSRKARPRIDLASRDVHRDFEAETHVGKTRCRPLHRESLHTVVEDCRRIARHRAGCRSEALGAKQAACRSFVERFVDFVAQPRATVRRATFSMAGDAQRCAKLGAHGSAHCAPRHAPRDVPMAEPSIAVAPQKIKAGLSIDTLPLRVRGQAFSRSVRRGSRGERSGRRGRAEPPGRRSLRR